MVEITEDNVEDVLDSGTCHCGLEYMVLKIKDADSPQILHKNPPCEQYKTLPMPMYHHWVKTGVASVPPEPPKPSRRDRRRLAHRKRRSVAT